MFKLCRRVGGGGCLNHRLASYIRENFSQRIAIYTEIGIGNEFRSPNPQTDWMGAEARQTECPCQSNIRPQSGNSES